MANDLLKNRKKTFVPYLPALDATPYVPARPAWTERRTEKVCTVETIAAVYETVNGTERVKVPVIDPEQGTIIRYDTITVHTTKMVLKTPARNVERCTNQTTLVEHPAMPAIPAFPGRQEQFATTLTDYHLGWNAGAQSIKSEAYGGYAEFSMPLVTGVVIGLSTARTSADADYASIGHALYFGNGTFKVMEKGAEVSGEMPYAAGDRFRISRVNGAVQYVQNGALVFDSARPSAGAMRLDASVYSGDDQVNDPVLEEGAPEPPVEPVAEGRAEVRAPMSYGRDGSTAAWGSASARAESGGYGAAVIEAPKYSIGIAMSYAPLASGYGLTGGVGWTGDPTMHPPVAVGASYSYGAGKAMSGPPMAVGSGGPSYHDAIGIPGIGVSMSGTVRQPNTLSASIPSIGGEILSAAKMLVGIPAIGAGMSGSTEVVGGVEFGVPGFATIIEGLTGAIGDTTVGILGIGATMSGGGSLMAGIPGIGAGMSGTVGAGAALLFGIPGLGVAIGGTTGIVGQVDVGVPGLGSPPNGEVFAGIPGFRVLTTGTVGDDELVLEAYSTNLRSDIEGGGAEMTRFTQFPILQVLRFNGQYYALAPDGLHRIEGKRDGAAPIPWKVSTGTTDFGARELKHIPSVYVGGRLGPNARFEVHEGERRDATYCYCTPRGQTAQNYRQHFGKGLRARYYSFTLSGSGEFELDGLQFELATSKRRL